jgi:uncharacterized protein YlzI (FlbEa/FlbD family)
MMAFIGMNGVEVYINPKHIVAIWAKSGGVAITTTAANIQFIVSGELAEVDHRIFLHCRNNP